MHDGMRLRLISCGALYRPRWQRWVVDVSRSFFSFNRVAAALPSAEARKGVAGSRRSAAYTAPPSRRYRRTTAAAAGPLCMRTRPPKARSRPPHVARTSAVGRKPPAAGAAAVYGRGEVELDGRYRENSPSAPARPKFRQLPRRHAAHRGPPRSADAGHGCGAGGCISHSALRRCPRASAQILPASAGHGSAGNRPGWSGMDHAGSAACPRGRAAAAYRQLPLAPDGGREARTPTATRSRLSASVDPSRSPVVLAAACMRDGSRSTHACGGRFRHGAARKAPRIRRCMLHALHTSRRAALRLHGR